MFDIHQKVYDDYGERAEEAVGDYIDGLMEEFAAAPEARPVIESGENLTWAAMMMEYGLTYCGVTPAAMSIRDFKEVVFELFPARSPSRRRKLPKLWRNCAVLALRRSSVCSSQRPHNPGPARRRHRRAVAEGIGELVQLRDGQVVLHAGNAGRLRHDLAGRAGRLHAPLQQSAGEHGRAAAPLPPEARTMLPFPGDVNRGSHEERRGQA